jgi:FKBP-type peptidyl-prolyl cis-trans isomerase FkpA
MKHFAWIMIALIWVAGCKKEDQADIDEALIVQYIADNQLDAVRTSTGLYYVIQDSGSTDRPGLSSTVRMYYTGKLINGEVFDGVNSPADPLELPLAWTIAGWQEGVPFYGRGGKGILLIPSELGYGEEGAGEIPKNAVLVFDIEVVDFL